MNPESSAVHESSDEEEDRPLRPLARSASNPAPKGILKRPEGQANAAGDKSGLSWDEQNLALNEIQKDSTMKIDEPKVRLHDSQGWPKARRGADVPRRLKRDGLC